MTKIQKTSRLVRKALQTVIILLPVFVCYYWLTLNTSTDILNLTQLIDLDMDISALTQAPLTFETRLLALLASLGLSAILLYALVLLVRLFKNYEQQEIFNFENALLYTKLARSIFYWVVGNFIYTGVLSVILSFNNPPGERVLQLTFTGVDIMTLFLGVVVLVISWVMKEGYEISQEHSHTI
ncbi:DUF2975 domain-containing protein [Terasakiella pusilla]|uniref:DUF2975 domain-containing protein n=1 Tax=Terasakiella pusilla TaxID=64973 RepID=UPI003AA8B664